MKPNYDVVANNSHEAIQKRHLSCGRMQMIFAEITQMSHVDIFRAITFAQIQNGGLTSQRLGQQIAEKYERFMAEAGLWGLFFNGVTIFQEVAGKPPGHAISPLAVAAVGRKLGANDAVEALNGKPLGVVEV